MSAKNTAVNILILTTFMSFLLYRRTGKVATVAWAKMGHAAQLTIFAAVAIFVIFLGVYGYFVEASVRIGLSVPQVGSVLFAMVSITAIDIFLFRGARTAEVRWGKIPAISQYVLIFIAVTFTWLMGLMGYVRSGLRQHWHVYGVIRDTSPDAFTPTLGFATSGRLGDRARVLPPDRLRVLDHEPARATRVSCPRRQRRKCRTRALTWCLVARTGPQPGVVSHMERTDLP